MWITSDVELPDALITAYNEERLVFFIGAGASMAPPSSLPSFFALAKEIAEACGRTWLDDDPRGLDGVLGDLDSDAVTDVHQRVAAIIGNPASLPNTLHRSIARLAAGGGPLRIVTTNYDRHLETVLEPLFQGSVPSFHAPALPVGDEFEGVVYLHGSLSRASESLVVTDSDFGRAYLTDAWAARFLERMFRKFAVLFVGYSHTDVVMRYLARGLPRDSERYSLTDAPGSGDWKRFGIRSIGYQHNGDHAELSKALERWADLSEMDLLSHEKHLASILGGSPWTTSRDEDSYVRASIDDPVRVAFFSKHATQLDWLEWFAGQAQFATLHESNPSPGSQSTALAEWIADKCVVADEISSAKVFELFCRTRKSLARHVWFSITIRISRMPSPRAAWLNRWIEVLVRDAPRDLVHLIEGVLRHCTWETDRDVALLVLERLTSPFSNFDSPWFDFGDDGAVWPNASIELPVQPYVIDSIWQELFKPNLPEVAVELLSIFEANIRRALAQLDLHAKRSEALDSVSFGRTAIEPHNQDSVREAIDPLIDGTRDSLEQLLRSSDDVGSATIDRFERSGILLLERIAIHGWHERTDRSPTEKLRWIAASGLLFRFGAKHEVFRLIHVAGNEASAESRSKLVELALQQTMDDRTDAYEVFNFLVWLRRVDRDWEGVHGAIAEIRNVYADFEERESPDLDSYVSDFLPASLGLEPEELHSLLVDDASAGLQRMRVMAGSSASLRGWNMHEVQGLLSSTIADFPSDAPTVLRELARSNEVVDCALRGAVVRGLEKADFEDSLLNAVLAEVSDDADLSCCVREFASLLEALTKDAASISADRLEALLALSARLWRLGPDEESGISGGRIDALLQAINHWAGKLALFQINAVRAVWLAAGDGWRGMPANHSSMLREIVTGDLRKHRFARTIVASQVHLLFAADEALAGEVVVPLFSWEHAETAIDVWDAYLFWGRWNDRLLLVGGMLDMTVETFEHLSELGSEPRQRFAARLGDIAVNSGIDPVTSGWLPKFVARATVEDRVAWTTSVGHAAESEVLAESSWASWMKAYIAERAAGIPASMTVEEASAAVGWLLNLNSSFELAVAALGAFHPKISPNSRLLYELGHDSTLPDRYPAAVARLLAAVLAGTTEPLQWECLSLKEVVERLGTIGADLLRPIFNEATRLGCVDAFTWM